MPQEATGGALDWVREWWAALVWLATLVGAGLVARLGRFFPTRSEFDGLGNRVGTAEKLMMGQNDKIADHEKRIEKTVDDVREVREHGSEVSRRTEQTLTQMRIDVAEIKRDIKHLIHQRRSES